MTRGLTLILFAALLIIVEYVNGDSLDVALELLFFALPLAALGMYLILKERPCPKCKVPVHQVSNTAGRTSNIGLKKPSANTTADR